MSFHPLGEKADKAIDDILQGLSVFPLVLMRNHGNRKQKILDFFAIML